MDLKNSDWAELPYFLSAARAGSLRAAAQAIGSTHATVDRQIRALETSYGARLFDRTPGGLHLTRAGEVLFAIAKEAEAAMIAARRRVEGLDREDQGVVRVTVPPSLAYDVLAPVFARFAAAHPGIELDIVVTNRFQDLGRAEADVSVRIAHGVEDDVIGRRVLTYKSGIYANRDYLTAHWPPSGPGGEGLTWIGWGDGDAVPDWVRQSPFPRARVAHAVREGVMQLSLIAAGAGIGYLPCYVESAFAELTRVPGTTIRPDRSIWLLLHSDLRETARVRRLVDFLSKELGAMKRIFAPEV